MEQTTCLIGNVAPITLPWGNHSLNVDNIGSARGVSVSIGTPPQFFSMRPSSNANNTFVVNANLCPNGVQNYSCVAYNNGVYTTQPGMNGANSEASWNGTQYDIDIEQNPSYGFVYFNDEFKLGNGDVVPGVPFLTYRPTEGADTSGTGLALGSNSSFIETALAAEVISTRAWSMWPGSIFNNPVDGVVVIGGYDEDRISSGFTEFQCDPDGTMTLNITGLEWQPDTGTTVDLMPSGADMIVGYPESYFEVMHLPQSSFKTLVNATGGTTADGPYPFWFTQPFGSLVVTLSNGMQTNIPALDLFLHPYNYTENGYAQVIDTDSWEIAAYPNSGFADNTVLLGTPFLSQHLLVSDPTQGKFWLADAVKTDFSTPVSKMRALCTGGPPSPTPTPVPKPKSNIAAIAGGAGGGVGALIIFGLVIFFILRRHKKKQTQTKTTDMSNGDQQTSMYTPEKAVYQPTGGLSPPPKYPSVHEADVGTYQPTSPQMSAYSGSSPQRQSNGEYLPWNRSYDPGNHELPTNATTHQPNLRQSTISPEPVEM